MTSTNPFAGKDNPGIPERQKPRRGQRGLPKRSTPENIENWERDVECVRMRKLSIDWDTIRETLGYTSNGHAHDRYLHVLREYPRDDVEDMRDMELLAIEKKMNQLEDKCAQGDSRSIEVWNKLSERKAKLYGIDAPERKEISVLTNDLVEQALAAGRAELARVTAALPPKMIEMVQSGADTYETVTPPNHPSNGR
jgi:hypothetical protein